MKNLAKTFAAFTIPALVATLSGCSATIEPQDDPGTSVDNVAASVGRATLDGYWKRAEPNAVIGITFNKCIGLSGLAAVRFPQGTATCKPGTPDVGSYTIHGKDGAPIETGAYQIKTLTSAGKRGKVDLYPTGKNTSYPLEYDLTVQSNKASALRLFTPGSNVASAYRADAASLPKSCDPASAKRVDGNAFLGSVDFNWFGHDYSIGNRGDEMPFDKLFASRPFRFDAPACDVQATLGITSVEHVNGVCDGVYEVAVGDVTQSVVWKERRTTFPRFFSLSEALHALGGDGEGWKSTVGSALTPLVDLNGKTLASCEADLTAEKAKRAKAGDRATLSREEQVNQLADDACKILFADTQKLVVDASGKPKVRFVQVFEKAVFLSTGEANGDTCLTKP